MKYAPKPKNRKPDVASLVLLITAALLFFLGSQYYTKGRPIVQTLGIVCLALAAFFIMKKLTCYVYTVYPKDRDTEKKASELSFNELCLMISKKNGAKGAETNKACLDISSLVAAIDLPSAADEKKKIIRDQGTMSLFYYTVTFLPPESLLLVFKNDGAKTGVVIEPNAELRGFFIEAARANLEKQNKENEEE